MKDNASGAAGVAGAAGAAAGGPPGAMPGMPPPGGPPPGSSAAAFSAARNRMGPASGAPNLAAPGGAARSPRVPGGAYTAGAGRVPGGLSAPVAPSAPGMPGTAGTPADAGRGSPWAFSSGYASPGSSSSLIAGAPVLTLPGQADSALGPGSSYADRLKWRREMREKRNQELLAVSTNANRMTEAQLREYNLKIIEAGGELGPALPIPLTQEEDDELVRKGVLPPQQP